MNPEDIITIDYKKYRVVICNNTYAGLELVENPRVTKMIRIRDYFKPGDKHLNHTKTRVI
jgi:hypothetical protein